MPQPPGILSRVNYVTKKWEDPCNAPWQVYIETAAPAALELFISLASFGLDDVVREAFRPGSQRTAGHGLRRNRSTGRGRTRSGGLGRSLGGLLNPGELLGDSIGRSLGFKPRQVSNGVAFLWKIDGVLQRGLFWWMVADLASEFAFNWTSQLYKTEFCQQAGAPVLDVDGSAGILGIQGWNSSVLENVNKATNGASWNESAGSLGPEAGGTVTAIADMTNTGAETWTLQARLKASDRVLAISAPTSASPGSSATAAVTASLTAGQAFTPELKITNGSASGTIEIYGQGSIPANPPPG